MLMLMVMVTSMLMLELMLMMMLMLHAVAINLNIQSLEAIWYGWQTDKKSLLKTISQIIFFRYVAALTSLYEQYNPKYGDIDTKLVITWFKVQSLKCQDNNEYWYVTLL